MFSSSDPEKAPHDLAEKSVKELQSMAVDVDLTAPQRRAPVLSRAGQLHLIDDLSRTAGAGLGVAAGLCVFLAVTIGRDLPVRAGAWLVIVGAALYVCRSLQRDFRRGDAISTRPFRWRAHYTSALSVLSAALGAGVIMLGPSGGDPALAAVTAPVLMIGLAVIGLCHTAHGASLAAALMPGLSLASLGAFRALGVGALSVTISAILIAATALGVFLHYRQFANAKTRFPRAPRLRFDELAPETTDNATIDEAETNRAIV